MTLYTLTVPNKNGGYDGDMVVRQFKSLNVSAGNTLTTDQPCRGLLIYVQGNCNIDGILTMQGKGAYANPTVGGASDGNAVDSNGLRFPFKTAAGSSSISTTSALLNGCGTAARTIIANHPTLSSNGTILSVVRQGANGGGRTGGGTPISTNPGANGTTGQSGGGGSGGGYYNQSSAGAGSYGSCFGGGSGGGGTHGGSSGDATAWGGPGGNGATPDGGYSTPGGIGNGNGTWSSTNTLYGNNGTSNTDFGTGGLLILIVGGNLTIGASGSINANGKSNGNFGTANERAGGGSSGGGNVILAYAGAYNNSGSVTATGGSRGGWGDQTGGAGGNGSVQTLQIL